MPDYWAPSRELATRSIKRPDRIVSSDQEIRVANYVGGLTRPVKLISLEFSQPHIVLSGHQAESMIWSSQEI